MSAKRWSIATLTSTHRKIALDANVLIYLLEGHEPLGRHAGAVVDSIEAGDVAGSMATIGQFEILAGPARVGDAPLFERSADEIRSMGLRLIPLTSEVAEEAAWLRGQGGLELGDAIHVATARVAGATAMITNDRGIRSRPGLEVRYLDDLVTDDPSA
ncbi:MAG TPA: PIN domain-containing protein [Candidatus Limnocylindrales bacterium]|nr:PIN domain-containing protein [Candidatus Limnocylindrales bacterium]